jgi:hypothetical protein
VMWYRREERERDRPQPGSPLPAAPGSCSRVEDLVQALHSGGVSPALEVGPANPAHAAQTVMDAGCPGDDECLLEKGARAFQLTSVGYRLRCPIRSRRIDSKRVPCRRSTSSAAGPGPAPGPRRKGVMPAVDDTVD